MLGAIIGDITGSTREFKWKKLKEKSQVVLLPEDGFFTDDTVMTVAVGNATRQWLALPEEKKTEAAYKAALVDEMQALGRLYPDCSYGNRFREWLVTPDPRPYNSWGNGSAMRVSAISLLASTRAECEALARWSAEVTHNHPEGVQGAVCTAVLGFLARTVKDKEALRREAAVFYPRLSDPAFTVDWLYDTYEFTERCRYTVPQAIECFLEAESFEETIVNCIYIGGDCDTSAAIAGGIAEAFYGVPEALKEKASRVLFRDDNVGDLTEAVNKGYWKKEESK